MLEDDDAQIQRHMTEMDASAILAFAVHQRAFIMALKEINQMLIPPPGQVDLFHWQLWKGLLLKEYQQLPPWYQEMILTYVSETARVTLFGGEHA